MTPHIKQQPWREREQPYLRPRISRDDIEQARRDAEIAEAEEQAAKRICMILVAVAVVIVLVRLMVGGQ